MGQPTAEQTALIIETTSEAIAHNNPKDKNMSQEIFVGVSIALIVAVISRWLLKGKK